MTWATRRHCHVDRVGSAWLIKRFIDRDAAFVFVDDPDDVRTGAIPFDIPGVALSHHRGRCTFETLLAVYDLDDPALDRLGRVVHEVDLEDGRYDAPEAGGLDALVRGLARTRDDADLLAATGPVLDGLYDEFRAQSAARAHLD
jgi:hypothetical protein